MVGLLHQSKTEDDAEFRLESQKVGAAITVEIAEVKLSERRISLQLPRDADADEWRSRQQSAEAPAGAMAEQLRAALAKKRRVG